MDSCWFYPLYARYLWKPEGWGFLFISVIYCALCSFFGSAASCPKGGSVNLAMNSDAVMLALGSFLVFKVRVYIIMHRWTFAYTSPTQFISPQRRNIWACECWSGHEHTVWKMCTNYTACRWGSSLKGQLCALSAPPKVHISTWVVIRAFIKVKTCRAK